MTERPNLFNYATIELSQDAFLCWLIQWADTKYEKVDPILHRTGVTFLNSIGRKYEQKPFEEAAISQVEIQKQFNGIDVLASFLIGRKKCVLVIEDKTGSTVHNNQLSRYCETVEKHKDLECYDHKLFAYLKIGEILPADRRKAQCSKYLVYSRNDFLEILKPNVKKTKNSILIDFYSRLDRIDDDYNKSRNECTSEWSNCWRAWEGFFRDLSEEMQNREQRGNWFFVNNRSGGEYIFDLSWRKIESLSVNARLAIVTKWDSAKDNAKRCFLAFKVGPVSKKMGRSSVRKKFYESLKKKRNRVNTGMEKLRNQVGLEVAFGWYSEKLIRKNGLRMTRMVGSI